MKSYPKLINRAGKRVPSVSTITKVFCENMDPLLWWANKGGLEGKTIKELQMPGIDVGHVCHKLIDADFKGIKADLAEYPMEAIIKGEKAFKSVERWKEMVHLKVIATELPLVSEEHQYGGIVDCIGEVDGALGVIDWKTSNSTRLDFLVKLAAYGRLWDENNPLKKVFGYHLLRPSKEEGVFHYHNWLDLSSAWEVFKDLIDIHYRLPNLRAIM